jgi:hypothetical protein
MANPYRIQLLNDLHTYFPELLYNHQRFRTTSDVLGYINTIARSNGNYQPDPYGYYSRMHRYDQEDAKEYRQEYRQEYQYDRRQRARPNIPVPPSPDISVDDEPSIVFAYRSYVPLGNNLSSLFSQLVGDSFSQQLHDLLEDVPIIPTDEQLRNNTTVVTLTEDKSDNCAICQDPLLKDQETRTINHCHHMFHQTCVDTWFQRNIHCPNCRHDIRL